jgi:hypothetical protein
MHASNNKQQLRGEAQQQAWTTNMNYLKSNHEESWNNTKKKQYIAQHQTIDCFCAKMGSREECNPFSVASKIKSNQARTQQIF